MPPRKKPTRRKKSSSATTPTPTPTPVDDHISTTPEVETGAEVADAAIVKWDEMLKPVEASISNHAKIDADSTTSNHAKIDGDLTTSVVISPESMIKEEGVLENSAAGDVNEARNEGENKVTEDLGLKSEDIDKGKQGVENDEPDETVDKEKEDSYHGSENVDQHKQGSGIDAVVKGDNEEEKQENTEVILASTQESNADKAPCNNDAALVVEDGGNGDRKGNSEIVSPEDSVEAVTTKASSENNIATLFEDDVESDDGSEEDDADNEGDEDPCEDPVSVDKKDKDIEIYVGGLHKNTVEDDLLNVFQQFGELKSTRIVRNSTTKKSKGFAFVRFVSPDQAKRALSELKDGVEVRGKHVKISESQDNHTLYLGNISKTWKKEEVLQQLKQYGIEHIEMIRLPEKLKTEGKNKGFAFLEFNTHSDAVAAFQRLQKPDAVFGRDISAKVAFAQAALHQNDEVLSQAKRVYLEGLTKEWNEEKVKEICGKYGEIVKIELCQNPRTKNKDFGFITFTSNENALACVEGINNAGTRGEVKIKANFAKPHPKSKEGVRGGFKVEASTSNKKGEISKETSEPKLRKIKGGLNSQQLKRNKKDTSKNKAQVHQQKGIIKNGESSRKAELTDKKGDLNSQQRKRKASSKQNLNPPPNLRHGDQGTPKKPKFGGEGQNSKSASKPGSHKRKVLKYEGREDGGSRNPHSKKPLKKLKGNIHGRERDNYRNTYSDSHIRRGHDDYRNSTRYTDTYAPAYAASSVYHLAPDSLSTRRFKEMEPHAGYIEPASATHSRSYSGYVQPVVRPHNPHQTVYLSPGAGSQSQSQPHSRYSDRSFMTQTHRGYIETAVVPEVQPYRGYQQSSFVQIARDPYDSGLSRTVRHDGRGTAVTYVGGRPLPSSQVRNYTSYYQGGGSYNASSSSQRTYY